MIIVTKYLVFAEDFLYYEFEMTEYVTEHR